MVLSEPYSFDTRPLLANDLDSGEDERLEVGMRPELEIFKMRWMVGAKLIFHACFKP